MFARFYDVSARHFSNPRNEPGTIDKRHGYVVWPVSIAVWACAETLKRSRDRDDGVRLGQAVDAMDRHWNPNFKGYTAWIWSPGNRDLYFDDNAHAGNALVTAYEASGERRYLDRALELTKGLIGTHGWDQSGSPGGVAWHLNNADSRNACSTLSVAVLACRLALLGQEREWCTRLARACIEFSERHLIADEDGLVLDSYQRKDGKWTHDRRKFTYNSGFAVEAFLLWSRLSGDHQYHVKATVLALKTITPTCVLFDDTLQDLSQRVWWDTVFFAHHLVGALALVAEANVAESEPGREITKYLTRLAAWCRTYIHDPADQMYFRNLRMYYIDEARTQTFNRVFHADRKLNAQGGERENGPGPVQDRPLIKTLIANASMVRIFLCTSDLVAEVQLLDRG